MIRRDFIKLFSGIIVTSALIDLPCEKCYPKDFDFNKIKNGYTIKGNLMIQWGATNKDGRAIFTRSFPTDVYWIISYDPLEDSSIFVKSFTRTSVELQKQGLYQAIGAPPQ